MMHILLSLGDWFKTTTIEQYQWGACGVKPTTLLYAGTDLPKYLNYHKATHMCRPQTVLLGKDDTGRFRTAHAKEYPAALSRSLADALVRDLPAQCSPAQELGWDELLYKFAAVCETNFAPTWLPDYQKR